MRGIPYKLFLLLEKFFRTICRFLCCYIELVKFRNIRVVGYWLQCIFAHVIFSSFTPLVPIHDRARNTTENSFVHKIDENSPVVRWKFHSILSITSNVTPHSFRVE